MKRTLFLGLIAFSQLSCSGAVDGSTPPLAPLDSGRAGGAAAEVESLESTEPGLDDVAPSLPAGTFADLAALCAVQRREAAAAIAENVRRVHELGDDQGPIVGRCGVDEDALKHARVSLAGGFLEARAITYETGFAIATSLAVRTREGWIAVREPLVAATHDDPGCPSILRDLAIDEVHVEGGALVVVVTADRGWGDGSSLVLRRARACRVPSDARCSEPVTIAARRVTTREDGEHEEPLFATPYHVDAKGGIASARTWDEPEAP